jgi:hypothetical protein
VHHALSASRCPPSTDRKPRRTGEDRQSLSSFPPSTPRTPQLCSTGARRVTSPHPEPLDRPRRVSVRPP